MIMRKLSLALVSLAAFAASPTAAQSPPFNEYSIGTLGGNCSVSSAIPYQDVNGATKCTPGGLNGQVMALDGSGVPEWISVAGTGTVTSVGLSLPSIFSVTGSPITASGTLAATLASQSQNLFFASPNGSSGAPSFRAMVAGDLPLFLNNAFAGSTSGSTVVNASAVASGTLTLPAATDTLIGRNTTDTLTNKSISAPQINSGQFANARLPDIMSNGTGVLPTYGNSIATTATTTIGSPSITVTSATGLVIGQQIFGTPIASETRITNIAGTTVTMSKNATATNASPVAVTFGTDRWSSTSSYLTNTIGATNLYLGAAAEGNFSWLNEWSPGTDYPTLSKLISIPNPGDGGVAATFASRSSDNNGLFGAALNTQLITVIDSYNGAARDSWGLYNESDLTSAVVGRHIGEENSIYSKWAYTPTDPYSFNQLGGTRNLRLDCGKGPTGPSPTTCSGALEIVDNDAQYGKGIVFGANAMAPFVDGTQIAINMATNQAIHWFSANNTPAWYMTSTKTSGAARNITLSDNAMTISNGADIATGAHIFAAAGAPAISACGGGSPTLSAGSTDLSGIVTEGTTATGCVLTFVKPYAFPPTCVVSSPSGNAFTSYSASTTALTIVNASASGNKYAYVCIGG